MQCGAGLPLLRRDMRVATQGAGAAVLLGEPHMQAATGDAGEIVHTVTYASVDSSSP